MRALLIVSAKILFSVLLATVVFILAVGAFFFATSEFHVGEAGARRVIERYLPAALEVKFVSFDLLVRRPEGLAFAKVISLQATGFCVHYGGDGVSACFDRISLSATVGWGGERLEHERWFQPRIILIDPVRMLGGGVRIDPSALPKSRSEKKTSGFDTADFLRRHVLPKWKIAGSRIEFLPLKIVSKGAPPTEARFILSSLEDGRLIRADLLGFTRGASAGPRGRARLDLRRSDEWLFGAGRAKQPWKLTLDGNFAWGVASAVDFDAKADLHAWNDAKFRLRSGWRGVSALRDVHLEGQLQGSKLDSRLSLKMGSMHSQVRTLDFVDCNVDADLTAKTGGLSCGPQTVRLGLYQKSGFRNPRLFTLAPEFELRVTKLEFGEKRKADLKLGFKIDQLGILRAQTDIAGHIASTESGLMYGFGGDLEITAPSFRKIAVLLRETPYSIPAPLNELDGTVSIAARLDASQEKGAVQFHASTQLDSRNQAVHLRFDGDTGWKREDDKIVPATQAALYIDLLKVSAPRFDLRKPPVFKPDRRFVRLTPERVAQKTAPPKPSAMPFRLTLKTTKPRAIEIATNLTKAPIPVDVDLVYIDTGKGKPKTSGRVAVGKTSLEIFRRNATLESFKLDLAETGEQRISGNISVTYLEYDIFIQLLGEAAEPDVRLSSHPPLERDQIIGVLIFGRPWGELDNDQQRSASNLNAAFAEAALGISSLYLLASTPVESVGYDPDRDLVTARIGLGAGTSLELGAGGDSSSVGVRKRLTREFVFRSEVERLGSTGKRTVSALIEWVKRF